LICAVITLGNANGQNVQDVLKAKKVVEGAKSAVENVVKTTAYMADILKAVTNKDEVLPIPDARTSLGGTLDEQISKTLAFVNDYELEPEFGPNEPIEVRII
jgi:hypothetical protein